MKVKANPKVFMLMAGVALVGGLAGSYFQWSSLQEQVAKADELRTQMRDETETKAELEKSTVKLQETAVKLSHLEKGVPQFAYVATMLKELDKAGTDNGLQVLGVRPVMQAGAVTAQKAEGAVKARKPYEELNIEVKCRGNYRSVMNFVSALKSFPKIVAARTVSLSPKVDSAGKNSSLDVTIELRAYLFAPTQPAPTTQSSGRVEASRQEARNNNG